MTCSIANNNIKIDDKAPSKKLFSLLNNKYKVGNRVDIKKMKEDGLLLNKKVHISKEKGRPRIQIDRGNNSGVGSHRGGLQYKVFPIKGDSYLTINELGEVLREKMK